MFMLRKAFLFLTILGFLPIFCTNAQDEFRKNKEKKERSYDEIISDNLGKERWEGIKEDKNYWVYSILFDSTSLLAQNIPYLGPIMLGVQGLSGAVLGALSGWSSMEGSRDMAKSVDVPDALPQKALNLVHYASNAYMALPFLLLQQPSERMTNVTFLVSGSVLVTKLLFYAFDPRYRSSRKKEFNKQ